MRTSQLMSFYITLIYVFYSILFFYAESCSSANYFYILYSFLKKLFWSVYGPNMGSPMSLTRHSSCLMTTNPTHLFRFSIGQYLMVLIISLISSHPSFFSLITGFPIFKSQFASSLKCANVIALTRVLSVSTSVSVLLIWQLQVSFSWAGMPEHSNLFRGSRMMVLACVIDSEWGDDLWMMSGVCRSQMKPFSQSNHAAVKWIHNNKTA